MTDLFADGTISIHGAQENNLKDVSLDIPKHKTTVFAGLSGGTAPCQGNTLEI